MFKTIRNAWVIPDLRKKILFTLLIIIVFRIGSVIPVPFIDTNALQEAMAPANSVSSDVSNNMIAYLNTLSGGAFSNATIFAMGITPYINSSIIIQLLCVAIPALERLSKEGEAGRKKIGAITRYVTVGLGLIQGTAYFFYLHNSGITKYREGFDVVFAAIVIVLVFTAGTALMMWLGEQINKNGIGNGISILLFAGIIARLPFTINMLVQYWGLGLGTGEEGSAQPQYFVFVILWVLIFLAVIWIITFMQDSERRIPIQYAKRVVGRKMYGGQSSHLPIKVALGGVLTSSSMLRKASGRASSICSAQTVGCTSVYTSSSFLCLRISTQQFSTTPWKWQTTSNPITVRSPAYARALPQRSTLRRFFQESLLSVRCSFPSLRLFRWYTASLPTWAISRLAAHPLSSSSALRLRPLSSLRAR